MASFIQRLPEEHPLLQQVAYPLWTRVSQIYAPLCQCTMSALGLASWAGMLFWLGRRRLMGVSWYRYGCIGNGSLNWARLFSSRCGIRLILSLHNLVDHVNSLTPPYYGTITIDCTLCITFRSWIVLLGGYWQLRCPQYPHCLFEKIFSWGLTCCLAQCRFQF